MSVSPYQSFCYLCLHPADNPTVTEKSSVFLWKATIICDLTGIWTFTHWLFCSGKMAIGRKNWKRTKMWKRECDLYYNLAMNLLYSNCLLICFRFGGRCFVDLYVEPLTGPSGPNITCWFRACIRLKPNSIPHMVWLTTSQHWHDKQALPHHL